MDILTETFHNSKYNLAICVFPPDTLRNTELERKLTSFTTFYAHRLNQLVHPDNQLEIYQTPTIEAGLSDLEDEHNHILFVSSGVQIKDMSILYDIKKIIDDNEDYLAAGVIRHPEGHWFEIHHGCFLVNVKKWIRAGSPPFGAWDPKTEELPVIEKTVIDNKNFTISFTGEFEETLHRRQGWNLISVASRNELEIFSFDAKIQSKFKYYYPEYRSESFLQGLNDPNHTDDKLLNVQKDLIKFIKNYNMPKIWLTNTETIEFELDFWAQKKYDTVALPAAGFKIINAVNYLNDSGRLIIYDFNQLSLDWARYLYESKETDVLKLAASFEHREYFYASGQKAFPDLNSSNMTKLAYDSINRSIDSFGSVENFSHSLELYRNSKVEFIKSDLFSDPKGLSERFDGHTLISVSNIFSTDYSAISQSLFENQKCLKYFLDSINTSGYITGQDAYCNLINHQLKSKS